MILTCSVHFSTQMLPEEVPTPQGAGAAILQQLKGGDEMAHQGTKKSSRGEFSVTHSECG